MLLFFAVICGLVESIFTALEVALGTVSRARLRALAEPENARGDEENAPSPATVRRARLVLKLLETPDRLTLLFLTVTSLSLWCAASLLTLQVLQGEWSVPVLTGALIILLFIAEVLPLLIAAGRAEAIALRGARLVMLSARILRPLTFIFAAVAYGIARVLGSGPRIAPHVTEGEIRTALAAAEEEGVLEADERALIEGAMDLRDKTVREVMTPREEIVAVEADTTLEQTLELALSEGHSRLPVYEKSLDHILGVLATKDLLPFLHNGKGLQNAARTVVRPALIVPANGRVDTILDELRRNRTLVAIVQEEDKRTLGLVTLEDLLEELVGEIQDEYDAEEAPIQLLETTVGTPLILCGATSSARELGRFFGIDLKMTATLRDENGVPVSSNHPIGTLALQRLQSLWGREPVVGDQTPIGTAMATTPDIKAEFELWLEVTRMENAKIDQVQVSLRALE